MSKMLAIALLVVVGVSLESAAPAHAEDYGVVVLTNPTRSTLFYEFQWGANGAWAKSYLSPGGIKAHYVELDANNCAPAPNIRFDNGVGNVKLYALSFYAANRVNAHSGKLYSFYSNGPYFDLSSKR